MAKVNTLERRNPLPAGTYWIDVFGLNVPKFDNWLKAFRGLGVRTDATQRFEAPNMSDFRQWYKFSYAPVVSAELTPVIWDATFGFPSIADSSIQSSEDTVSRPDLPLDPLDRLSNWMNSIEQRLGGSIGSIAAVVPYAILGAAGYGAFLLASSLSTVRKVKKLGKRNS